MARFYFPGILLCLFVAGCGPKKPSDPRYQLLKGDGISVERRELDLQIREKLQQAKIREGGSENLQAKLKAIGQEGLEEVLERELLRKEAKRLELWDEVRKAAKAETTKFQQRYPSKEERKKFFAATGIDEDIFEERVLDRFTLMEIEKKTGLQKPRPAATESPIGPRRNMPGPMANRMVIQQIQLGAKEKKEGEAALPKAEQKRLAGELAKQWKESPGTPWPSVTDASGKTAVYQRREYPVQAAPAFLKAAAAKLKANEFSPVIEEKEGFFILHAVSMADLMQQREADRQKARQAALAAQQAHWDSFIATLKERYHVETVGKIEDL